ncbi:MAG: uracil-DNA glycosylase [Candidatus Melainabacteria bacterium GWF2_32_7]|nr:MAG: uracil-DNA glycosylase [Candidatus Melainabacteria bacterium GWF2_32_7]
MPEDQLSLFNYSETNNDIRNTTLKDVKEVCKTCIKCDLSKSRTQVVFSDGNPEAKLMIIGEAPGRNEDETGIPFVGRAGKLLDKILLSQNITREKEVYICNTVKCRPPENRVPTDAEKEACRVYLDSQLQLIRPRLILLAGATAVKSMLDTKAPISKIRGQWFDGPLDSKIMPIFHPSYLLRNESKEPGTPKWLMWEDIQEVRRALDAL